jgi:hypothetical protein
MIIARAVLLFSMTDCAIIKRVYRVANSLATFNITLGLNFPIKLLVLKLLDELESVSDQSFGIHDVQQLINYPANVIKVSSIYNCSIMSADLVQNGQLMN